MADEEPLAVLMRELPRLSKRARLLSSPLISILLASAEAEIARVKASSSVFHNERVSTNLPQPKPRQDR
jgi:hypothetical protein